MRLEPYLLPKLLHTGRVVRLRDKTTDWGLGVVCHFYRQEPKPAGKPAKIVVKDSDGNLVDGSEVVAEEG